MKIRLSPPAVSKTQIQSVSLPYITVVRPSTSWMEGPDTIEPHSATLACCLLCKNKELQKKPWLSSSYSTSGHCVLWSFKQLTSSLPSKHTSVCRQNGCSGKPREIIGISTHKQRTLCYVVGIHALQWCTHMHTHIHIQTHKHCTPWSPPRNHISFNSLHCRALHLPNAFASWIPALWSHRRQLLFFPVWPFRDTLSYRFFFSI